MSKMNKGLLTAVVVMLLVCAFLWQTNYAQQPEIAYIEPSESEKALASIGGGHLSKYQISERLPAGTTIRVWIEAYEFGTRVEDVVAFETQLTEPARNVPFFQVQYGDEVALGIGAFPGGAVQGKYPVEKWSGLSSLGGSGWGGDLADGSLVVRVTANGLTERWLNGRDQALHDLMTEPESRAAFIRDNDYVYLLKVQAVKPKA